MGENINNRLGKTSAKAGGYHPDRPVLGEWVVDSNNTHIPVGIYLRRFKENAWYRHSASHMRRLLN